MYNKFTQLPHFIPNTDFLYKQGGFGYGQYTASPIYSGGTVGPVGPIGPIGRMNSNQYYSNESMVLINANKKTIEGYNNFEYIAAIIKGHNLSCVV
jgi:hypothetical protein